MRGTTHSYLITGLFLFLLFFRQHHPQGKETHYHPVAEVTKHHSKQKGECDDGVGSCRWETHLQCTYSELPYSKQKGTLKFILYMTQCEFLPGLTSR